LEERFAAYLQATDELGLPREAVVQALKEQLSATEVDTTPGTRLFAPSADGFLYSGLVVSTDNGRVRLRFDAGGEQLCELSELRPFALTPGTIVNGCWRGDDGWYVARVREYDAASEEVTLVYRSDGTVETLPLTRIRLPAPTQKKLTSPFQWVPVPLFDLLLKLGTGVGLGMALARVLGF
jgi:hypothetical protein